MGHISNNFPAMMEEYKKRNNKIHQSYVFEDDKPPKKFTNKEIEDYFFFLPS
jgi:hypothetical protein